MAFASSRNPRRKGEMTQKKKRRKLPGWKQKGMWVITSEKKKRTIPPLLLLSYTTETQRAKRK